MIIIVSNPEDTHARRVAQEIIKIGGQIRFLDMERVGQDVLLMHPISNYQFKSPKIHIGDETPILLEEVHSIWYRRPSGPTILSSVLDSDYKTFARKEWLEALNGLLISLDVKFVNPLLSQATATKPQQLEVAQRIGLRIPETLITNDPLQVEAFLQLHEGKVIHKSLTTLPNRFIDTRRWSESDREKLIELPICPVIFQEEVVGPADVRVTIVGDKIFSARLETSGIHSGIDSRLDLDIPYEPHDLPDEVRQLLLLFMQELGLVFSTIDLKISEEGNYVFFEANPQGQFLYVEILTGLPIASAMADLLTNS